LSQGPFDGREGRLRLTNQSQCPSLLEARFNSSVTLPRMCKRVEPTRGPPEPRGPTHLAKQHRALQERLSSNERVDLNARRENLIELLFRLHEAAGGRGVGRQ